LAERGYAVGAMRNRRWILAAAVLVATTGLGAAIVTGVTAQVRTEEGGSPFTAARAPP